MGKKSTILYCFSPLVMIITFSLEWLMAMVAFLGYRRTKFGQLAIFLLICLGLFQLTEYIVCTNLGPNRLWTLIGLVAITLLPPLGAHLVGHLTGRNFGVRVSYFLATIFILLFALVPTAVNGSVCTGNYMIISVTEPIGLAYGLYYFGFLSWSIGLAWFGRRVAQNYQAVLNWLMVGYLSFMVPMAIVYVLSEGAREAVPSIMCGFALILAIILIGRVLPLYHAIAIQTKKTRAR